jgi:hypothetical protein
MTNLILGIILGLQIGYFSREILSALRRFLNIFRPKNTSAVVGGAYAPKSTTINRSSVIDPKTPQRLEYEIHEAVKKEAGL